MLGRRDIAVAALSLAAFSAACKRTPPPTPSAEGTSEGTTGTTGTSTVAPVDTNGGGSPAPGSTATTVYDPFGKYDSVPLPDAEAPTENIDIPTGVIVTPGTPGTPVKAAPVDPFDAAIAETQTSAFPCFSSLPSAEYAATLVVSVTPSGRVTRVEVEPGNVTDASVLACLRAAAEQKTFPTSSGRTLRIEVRVTPKT